METPDAIKQIVTDLKAANPEATTNVEPKHGGKKVHNWTFWSITMTGQKLDLLALTFISNLDCRVADINVQTLVTKEGPISEVSIRVMTR